MASTNQSPFYKKAELKFLSAQTNEEKLEALEEMIKECPKHKSSEKMLANLKTRQIKLKEKLAKEKKSKKRGSRAGIKKEDMQAIILGKTSVGKSLILKQLTNVLPKISLSPLEKFTTKKPIVGIMHHLGTNIQLVEIPAIESEYYDKGLVHTADTILIVITNLEQLKEVEPLANESHAKKIIVFNQTNQTQNELRKISATLQSKKYNFVFVDAQNFSSDFARQNFVRAEGDDGREGTGSERNLKNENLEELKEKIFQSFDKIRVYTKEPGKPVDKNRPIILELNSTVKDAAEKILHGFSKQVKQTKIWGPSSKFSGQITGLTHKLKDLDVVEFKTK